MSPLFYNKIGKGQPIIIIHGLLGSSNNWTTFAHSLSENFACYLIDLRNHGKSFHNDEFNFHVMAQDIINFITEKNISQPIILGHSLGGKLAMYFAQYYDNLINKLIIVDILPDALPLDRFGNLFHHLLSLNLLDYKSRTAIDQALQKFIDLSSFRQFIMKNIGRDKEGKFTWKINLPVIAKSIPMLSEKILFKKQIIIPTLFIRGALSPYIPEDKIDYAKKMFPHLILSTIAEAGHWVYTDQPKAFTNKVLHFLQLDRS